MVGIRQLCSGVNNLQKGTSWLQGGFREGEGGRGLVVQTQQSVYGAPGVIGLQPAGAWSSTGIADLAKLPDSLQLICLLCLAQPQHLLGE